MRKRSLFAFACLVLMLVACGSPSQEIGQRVDSANEQSYRFRYLDVDSSLLYAQEALRLCEDATSLRAEAQNNRAFVAYQQMYYDSALAIVDEVLSHSRNQVELLCADVMQMKIAQRIGEGKMFFNSRHDALRRVQRIREEESTLTPHLRRRFLYAESELHIVSSTYYYYLGQDSTAIEEIRASERLITNMPDTAQWLYYHYMVGSGGMIQGEAQDVCLQEFDHLLRTYTVGSKYGYKYFCANALQSLASMVADTVRCQWLQQTKPSELTYLYSLSSSTDSTSSSAIALAQNAFTLFREYNDIFQMACAKRTLGELYSLEGNYTQALNEFSEALDYVERQADRSSRKLPQWMAGIHEQLSLTYSALGDTLQAKAHRAEYLSLLASTSQNFELQSRKEQLMAEVASTRLWLYLLLCMMALSSLMAFVMLRRLKRQASGREQELKQIHEAPTYQSYAKNLASTRETLQDEFDEVSDQLSMSHLNCSRYRNGNIERRAKVQMVYSIIPYLDRILAAVSRMKRQGRADEESLEYVHQLTDEIMRINDVLTSWIQISQGQVKLHVTSFPLQEVFTIVDGGRTTFAQKGVTLQVDETAAKVKADKALTLFMVNTLADNARKFTPEGGTVRVSAEETDSYVEVSVSDTGMGLSESDVATLNDSKVYDPQLLGRPDTGKGFGFGIMNCKGIIGKYRKSSDLFRVCEFGLESKEGSGSRFWFRLPRVLVALLFVLTASLNLHATTPTEPVDTAQLLQCYNDSAIAAQTACDWNAYRRYNSEYVRLHHLYTADTTLPAYCARMHQLQSDNIVLHALLVLFSLLVLGMFYMLTIRPRLTARKLYSQLLLTMTDSIQQAEAALVRGEAFSISEQVTNLSTCLTKYPAWGEALNNLMNELQADSKDVARMREENANLQEQLPKARFEEDRIYVMNQILDNCLSTIKHETMYYPARTAQMVEMMKSAPDEMPELIELYELVHYYKHVYMLLFEQANRQLEQNSFHREALSFSDISDLLSKDSKLAGLHIQLGMNEDAPLAPEDAVLCDRDLFVTLLHTLVKAFPNGTMHPALTLTKQGNIICFELILQERSVPEGDLFASSGGHLPFLIAKQIIREHDAYSGMPGLRLSATNTADGCRIEFTLKRIERKNE